MDELIRRARRNGDKKNSQESAEDSGKEKVAEENDRDSINILLDDSQDSSKESGMDFSDNGSEDVKETPGDSNEECSERISLDKESSDKGTLEYKDKTRNVSGGGKNLKKALNREKKESARERFKKLKEEAKQEFIEKEKLKKRQENEAKVTGDAIGKSSEEDESESLKEKYDRFSDGNILH